MMRWAAARCYVGVLLLDAGASDALIGSGGILFRFRYRVGRWKCSVSIVSVGY